VILPPHLRRILDQDSRPSPYLERNPRRIVYAGGTLSPALPVVAMETRELPPWWSGPYRQDVPVHGR